MRTVEEHRAAVLALVQPLPTVTVPLSEACGCALATNIAAPFPLPAFDNSAMDGYAVRAAEIAAPPVTLPVTADIPAGRGDLQPLAPGSAQRIMTGAPVPPGADAVVPVEWTDAGLTQVRIDRAPELGANIRRTGEDLARGEIVLRAGDEVTAARIGLLAALGEPTVAVVRRPRVAVLATGSEVIEPGNPLAPGQIYNSNGPLLAAQVCAAGAVPTQLPAVSDDVDTFRAALDEAVAWADLIVTAGGISAGAYEVVKDALPSADFVQVAMQPGRPQGTAAVNGVPLIAVPGNPVSAFVSFEVFVRPALRLLLGHRVLTRPTLRARLAESVDSRAGLRQFRRGWLDQQAGTVQVVGGSGSHLLGSLAQANCLAVVPEDVVYLDAGAEVAVISVD